MIANYSSGKEGEDWRHACYVSRLQIALHSNVGMHRDLFSKVFHLPALCKCTSLLCYSIHAYIACTSKSSNKLGLKSLKN